jgi:DNA primase
MTAAAIPDLLLRVVRGRVPSLRLERGHWRGDCPWCSDAYPGASPSLYVYPDNRYHCFTCGETGDAISFLMWDEGLRFMQAVEWLAAMAGMPLEPAP